MQLSDEVHQKITSLSEEGNALADEGKYQEANKKFIEALEFLPEPLEQWEACTWLLAAIGDMNYLQGSYEYAKKALSDAMHCPDAIGNPFIHLRLGQTQYELGDKEKAADELARAYMGAGKEIFETENPKYFEFLKTVLKPPANGKW
ncbi:MAG: tetratricopeptide repeat protein [Candidatus Thiodiazotropha endolucinida]|nr:tetratricopeptide repeat protein [Candidatus Thiodiazotropha taylori]MCW4319673.1 tetratricopeptide repeat protein [Candidatus Thiodiazotropha taylori]